MAEDNLDNLVVPEEEEPLSYMDVLGNALKVAFPVTSLVRERVAEGLISSIRPHGYTTDLTRARERPWEIPEGEPKTETSVMVDKTTRFLRGALGLGGDYTDEVAQEYIGQGSSTFVERDGRLENMEDLVLAKDTDIDVTNILKARKDRYKRAKMVAEARTDLFSLGLGRPQRYGHFVESQHRPSIGETDPTSEYIDFREGSLFKESEPPSKLGYPSASIMKSSGMRRNVLGRYKIDYTDSEYESYYDKWDFAGQRALGKLNNVIEALGLYRPREIYGRIPKQSFGITTIDE